MSMARNFFSWLISNNLGCLTNVAMDRLLLEKNEPQPGAKGQLIEAERMSAIGRMACSISHDMRHSLTAIYANAEFLERHDLSASEKAELLVDIQEAVLEMIERLDSPLRTIRTKSSLRR
jgi:signal transduction histidine kinase